MAEQATVTSAAAEPIIAATVATPAPTTTSQSPPTQGVVTQQAPAAPPTPDPLDPDYIARGGRWKLGEEDLRSVPRDVFERIHAAAEAELIENLQRARNVQQTQGQGQNQQTQYGQPPSQQAQQPQWGQPQGQNGQQAQQPSGPFKPVELKFDDADDDSPSVLHAKALNEGMTRNFNALYGEMQSQVQEVVQAIRALHEYNDGSILDRHITELGDEWGDVFGKGATMDMDSKLPTRAARDAYKKAILENLELDASLGRERNPSEAMLRARYRLYGQKIAAIERSKRETKAAEAAKNLPAPTGAPGNSKATAGGLRESAQRLAAEMWAKR